MSCGLLVHLQTSGIAPAFNRAFGYPVEALDVIGLFRQHGTHYFACCNSQGSCGPVYELDVEIGETRLCGFTDRFDWNFNTGTRAGGILPKRNTLQIVPLDGLVRRVKIGDAPYEAGPPHDLDVPWRIYAPREDES